MVMAIFYLERSAGLRKINFRSYCSTISCLARPSGNDSISIKETQTEIAAAVVFSRFLRKQHFFSNRRHTVGTYAAVVSILRMKRLPIICFDLTNGPQFRGNAEETVPTKKSSTNKCFSRSNQTQLFPQNQLLFPVFQIHD